MPDKIMVVDEDEQIRLLLTTFLTGEGFSVVTAKNRAEGSQVFENESPDLVIAESKLTLRHGRDLLNEIKAAGSGVEVILLIGQGDDAMAGDGLRRGAYDYLLKPLDEMDVLSASVQRALQKRRLEAKNGQLIKKMEEMGIKDPLTGLYNHRFMQERLLDEVVRSTRYHHDFLIFLVDIDHFKKINETYGRPFGDFALKRIARLLEDNLRLTDTVFRYGGDKFFLLLPETPKTQAVRIGERILESIRYHEFSFDGHRAQVTLSLAAAEFPHEARDSTSLIALVHRRLFRAKETGRDCFSFETLGI